MSCTHLIHVDCDVLAHTLAAGKGEFVSAGEPKRLLHCARRATASLSLHESCECRRRATMLVVFFHLSAFYRVLA